MSARTVAVLAIGVFSVAASALAADPPRQSANFGKEQYEARCMPCHGRSGKGDGPVAREMKMEMPDLATFARRNGGTFPTDLAWTKIDGRPTSFDVERRMPVWGRTFRHEALAGASKTPESYVATEIFAIIDHVKTLQAK